MELIWEEVVENQAWTSHKKWSPCPVSSSDPARFTKLMTSLYIPSGLEGHSSNFRVGKMCHVSRGFAFACVHFTPHTSCIFVSSALVSRPSFGRRHAFAKSRNLLSHPLPISMPFRRIANHSTSDTILQHDSPIRSSQHSNPSPNTMSFHALQSSM